MSVAQLKISLAAAAIVLVVGGCAATYQRVDVSPARGPRLSNEFAAGGEARKASAAVGGDHRGRLHRGDYARITTGSGDQLEGLVAALGDSVSLELPGSGGIGRRSVAAGDIVIAEVKGAPAIVRGTLGFLGLAAVVLAALIVSIGPMGGENGG